MAADLYPGVALVVRTRCDACAGSGGVRSEDWRAFDAWTVRRGLSGDARVDAVEEFFLGVCGYDTVPGMQESCERCDGTGKVDDELDVDELVDEVLKLVPAAVIPRGELEDAIDTLKQTLTAAALRSQGLADPDDATGWLRVVQEAAEGLRSLGEMLIRRQEG